MSELTPSISNLLAAARAFATAVREADEAANDIGTTTKQYQDKLDIQFAADDALRDAARVYADSKSTGEKP